MLAPMAPSSPLFLAIQNHKTDEIQSLLLTIDYRDSLKLSEGGYSAIHVACRYNNRFALELLLSKGVSIELADSNGNTPLHYAAKYGHIDIVRVLIDRGSSIVKKNNHHQNPYDVAENHVVRQFMLPLVFAAERNQGEQTMDYSPHMQQQQQQNLQPMSAPQSQYAPPPSGPQTMQPPPPSNYGAPPSQPHSGGMPSMMNPFQNRNTLPTTGYSNNSSSFGGPPPPGSEGIVPTYSHQTAAAIAQKPANIRTIQPDGFHSSASDPELQRKYGHTRETLNIAPPPTDFSYSTAPLNGNGIAVPAGPQSYYAPPPAAGGMGAGPPPSNVYSRYVPYDPHTNSAAPLPPMAVPAYTPAAQQQQQVPVPQTTTTPPSAPGNRLLGNKSISGEVAKDALTNNNAPAVAVNVRPPSQPNNILVFNPATDGEIINLGSTSSSVL